MAKAKQSAKNGADSVEKSQRRKPTIEAFRALMVFSETDSMTETARRLGVSQPVVTKKLEVFKDPRACGAVLLKTHGKATLTESAIAIIPAVRELVSRYDRLLRFLGAEEIAPQAVRIGTGSFAAEYYLPQVLAALRNTLEECQIETRVCRGRERILGTINGQFDLSIVTHDASQIRQILREAHHDETALTITPLCSHPVCVLAAANTPAGADLLRNSASHPISVTSLKRWELIGPDRQSGLRRQLERHFAQGELYFVAEGGGWAAAKAYALAGLGVAIVPLATVVPASRSDGSATTSEGLVCRRLAKEFAISDVAISRPTGTNPQVPDVLQATLTAAKQIAEILKAWP